MSWDEKAEGRGCKVDGCDGAHSAKGYCARHYRRAQRGAPVDTPIRPMRMFKSAEESFANRTEKRGECVIWTGAIDGGGYGMIWHNKRFEMVHRYAWERANGPIPDGMFIDHECFIRNCVNLSHLRLATPQQNVQSRSVAGRRSATGVRNVSRSKGGFRVRITKDGKRHNFGTFASLSEAEEVAIRGRGVLFGEFSGDKTSNPDMRKGYGWEAVGEAGPELVNFSRLTRRPYRGIYPPPHHRGSAADVEHHWPGCGHE